MKTREKKIYRVTIAGSIVNLLLLVFKFVAGIAGHSGAMIADAVHSLSDFITDVIVVIFVRVSSKPEDEDHAFGHGKYETLATQLIGMALLGVGLLLGWSGIEKIWDFMHGKTLDSPGSIALWAAAVSILMKELMYQWTHWVGKEVDSPALIANAWHHRSDALSSIGTLTGIGGAIFLGKQWTVLDPIAAVVVSIFIMVTALKLMAEASDELLEKSLPADVKEHIQHIVGRDTEVCDIHHLRTRKIGNRMAIEMHLRLRGDMPLAEAHDHASLIEKELKKEFGSMTHVMLHLEPIK